MLTRRSFIVRSAASTVAAGFSTAALLDLLSSRAAAATLSDAQRFGALEPLAELMQDMAPDDLLRELVRLIRAGERLETLVAAGALANARTFGGENYDGYHCFMALMPSLQMSTRLSAAERALPVLKVLHRSSVRIQAHGGRDKDVFALALPAAEPQAAADAALRERVHASDLAGAEAAFAAIAAQGKDATLRAIAPLVRDATDVHRVVLAWRAYETLRVAGDDSAGVLLRQVVHYCTNGEKNNATSAAELRELVPQLVRDHDLAEKTLGGKRADVAALNCLAAACRDGSCADGAKAMADALAAGLDLEDAGEALSLAASRLLLTDQGIAEHPTEEKPLGCVHGASIGVHASDSAHAWRSFARAIPATAAATLITGAYHTAGQSGRLGKGFTYADRLAELESATPLDLLASVDDAIGAGDQARACAMAAKFLATGGDGEALIARLLAHAVADDGALHAEKYFVTATDVYRMSRAELRDEHLVALARVAASQHVKQAQSVIDARALLG